MLVNAHREKSPIRPFAKARFTTERREQPGFRRCDESTVYAWSMRTLDLGMIPTLFHRWADLAVDNFGGG